MVENNDDPVGHDLPGTDLTLPPVVADAVVVSSSARAHKPRATWKDRKVTMWRSPLQEGQVNPGVIVGMKAAGLPASQIARATGLSEGYVSNLASSPQIAEQIAHYREQLRSNKIQWAHKVQGRVQGRFEKELDKGTAKDVDAMARALGALEKIEASVAGEQRPLGSEGDKNPVVELKILINQLLQDGK